MNYTCDPPFCDTFDDQKIWFTWCSVLGLLTTIFELLVTLYHWEEFLKIEMTSDDLSGWFHNKFFKHIEFLWEVPLMKICKLLCCELKKDNYKRRNNSEEHDNVIKYNKAARLQMSLFVIFHLGIELGQRVLDIPYFTRPSEWLNDCDGLKGNRSIQKPAGYYVCFIVVEVMGALLYTVYVLKIVKKEVRDGDYNHAFNMYHLLFSMIEIPVLMVLEFFFVERLLEPDNFFANYAVAINNILTLIFILGLSVSCIDFLMAQISKEGNLHNQDGKLDLHELLTVFCSALLLMSSSIRVYVNSTGKVKFSGPAENSTFCHTFTIGHVEEFTCLDWIYLLGSCIPSIWFIIWISSIITFNGKIDLLDIPDWMAIEVYSSTEKNQSSKTTRKFRMRSINISRNNTVTTLSSPNSNKVFIF